MLKSTLLFLSAAAGALAQQTYVGFNYGGQLADGSGKDEQRFEDEFNTAKSLAGTSAFTSARLYTMVQYNTTDTVIAGIAAAVKTKTTLLLGMWASAGQTVVDAELRALRSAIDTHGTALADLVVAISVGSEDLYRNSARGSNDPSGGGAQPDAVVGYIKQVRSALEGTPLAGKPIGHVDAWTAWVNESNAGVLDAVDFIGMNAFPYFEDETVIPNNAIDVAVEAFWHDYNSTLAAARGKPLWITETGWPVSGRKINNAVPSSENARRYWAELGCSVFGKISTWWFTLEDSAPLPGASFALVDKAPATQARYDLSCPDKGGADQPTPPSQPPSPPPPSSPQEEVGEMC